MNPLEKYVLDEYVLDHPYILYHGLAFDDTYFDYLEKLLIKIGKRYLKTLDTLFLDSTDEPVNPLFTELAENIAVDYYIDETPYLGFILEQWCYYLVMTSIFVLIDLKHSYLSRYHLLLSCRKIFPQ